MARTSFTDEGHSSIKTLVTASFEGLIHLFVNIRKLVFAKPLAKAKT